MPTIKQLKQHIRPLTRLSGSERITQYVINQKYQAKILKMKLQHKHSNIRNGSQKIIKYRVKLLKNKLNANSIVDAFDKIDKIVHIYMSNFPKLNALKIDNQNLHKVVDNLQKQLDLAKDKLNKLHTDNTQQPQSDQQFSDQQIPGTDKDSQKITQALNKTLQQGNIGNDDDNNNDTTDNPS